MDFHNASLFARVVELGSFTRAAASLELPKSSVSRGVSKLERELGVRLLQRTTRTLSLTDAGQRFFDRVRGALQGLEEAESAAREEGTEPRGTVRVTAPPDAATLGLGRALAEFSAAYPRIHVDLSLTSRVVDLVGEGIDLALRAGVLRDSTLVARRVGASDSGLFASPGYLKRRGSPEKLADLAGHEVLLYRSRTGRGTLHLKGPRGDESVDVKGPVSADELGLLLRIAVAGAGIGLFPLTLAAEAVHEGELEAVLPGYRLTGGGVFIVMPSSAFLPSRVAVLRDFLVQFLSKELERTEEECQKRPRRSARAR